MKDFLVTLVFVAILYFILIFIFNQMSAWYVCNA
jgi:hypothetical protein